MAEIMGQTMGRRGEEVRDASHVVNGDYHVFKAVQELPPSIISNEVPCPCCLKCRGQCPLNVKRRYSNHVWTQHGLRAHLRGLLLECELSMVPASLC